MLNFLYKVDRGPPLVHIIESVNGDQKSPKVRPMKEYLPPLSE